MHEGEAFKGIIAQAKGALDKKPAPSKAEGKEKVSA
jgi:hypothetical protein